MANSLLDRYDQMQKRPFGTNTALSDGNQKGVGGTAGSQYRRQAAAYGQALRILNREARRGNAQSALSAIAVRDKANAAGFAPGGIRDKAEADAGILGRVDAMQRRTAGMARAAEINDVAAQENNATVNPNATAGAGRGTPVAGRGTPVAAAPPTVGAEVVEPTKLSLSETDNLARDNATATGAFGTTAKTKWWERNRKKGELATRKTDPEPMVVE